MSKIINLWGSTISTIDDTGTGVALQVAAAGTVPSLVATQNALTGGATIAPIRVVASLASQAFFTFQGAAFSSASFGTTTVASAFVIPVYNEFYNTWGYLCANKAL